MGINFSRALSVKYARMVNAEAQTKKYAAIAIGRVMTCVLGMVVERERQIRSFQETVFQRIIGTFETRNGTYTGEWKADLRHGQGKYTWANGDVYEGMWKNGLMDGEGMLRQVDGTKYKGGYKEGLKEGNGVLIDKDGKRYEGTFHKDRYQNN